MMIELPNLIVTNATDAASFLASETGLPKNRVKDAMKKGAAWIHTKPAPADKQRRVRRAKAMLAPGDRLSFFYSENILAQVPAQPTLVEDGGSFSVWEKPPGLMSSGSRFGDHCAINRVVEQRLDRPTFLVHRLDRFVWGLMVLAHSKTAAANLSRQFQARTTTKIYRAEVHGTLDEKLSINAPVDGKDAVSHVTPLAQADGRSLIEIQIESGRKHQIRRHLAGIGHSIVGDLQYGSGDTGGLQLAAVTLGFLSPADGQQKSYQLSGKIPSLTVQDAN